jgi:hypothetical protein
MAKKAAPVAQGATAIEPVVVHHIETGSPIEAEAPVDAVDPEADTLVQTTDRRADMMKEIYANREAQLERENAEARRQNGVPDPEPVEEIETAPVVEAKPAKVEAQPKTEQEPEPKVEPVKRKIKVNGGEMELSEDELVRAAQLGLASEQKFNQAARDKAEAQALLRQAQQLQQNSGVPQGATRATEQPVDRPSTHPMDENEIKALAHKIQYGDAEATADAIRRLAEIGAATGRAPQGPTPEQVAAYAAEQALGAVRRESALNEFGSEYKDILADRYLTYLAAQNVQQLRQHYATVGVQATESQLYAEAGKMVREWKSGIAPQSSEPQAPATAEVKRTTVAPTGDRVERKRAAALQQPTAVAGAKTTMENPERPALTGSQIVQSMRKARHQPVFS